MTHNKRKKNTKYRGSKTHGSGAMKKRRGAGNRGGRGRAGSGKRADQKKPSYQKEGKGYLGSHGFKSISKIKTFTRVLNIGTLDATIDQYVLAGKATKKGENYEINLSDIKYQKLLSKGDTKKCIRISVDYATESAIEKIKTASGDVTLLKAKKEKKEKKAKKE